MLICVLTGCAKRVFFIKSSGRPRWLVMRILFHKSAKPRGIFRKYILNEDRTPRPIFNQWMTGEDYLNRAYPKKQNAYHNRERAEVSKEDFDTFISNNTTITPIVTPKYLPFVAIENKDEKIWNALRQRNDTINISLIYSLRLGSDISFNRPLTSADFVYLEVLADHLFLAYLRRYPSQQDCLHIAEEILRCDNINNIRNRLLSSEEYKKNGHRWMER